MAMRSSSLSLWLSDASNAGKWTRKDQPLLIANSQPFEGRSTISRDFLFSLSMAAKTPAAGQSINSGPSPLVKLTTHSNCFRRASYKNAPHAMMSCNNQSQHYWEKFWDRWTFILFSEFFWTLQPCPGHGKRKGVHMAQYVPIAFILLERASVYL